MTTESEAPLSEQTPEQLPVDTKQPSEEEVVEQPEGEVEEPAESGVEEKHYTEEEVEVLKRSLQSAKDKEVADISKRVKDLEGQISQRGVDQQLQTEWGQTEQWLAQQEAAELKQCEDEGGNVEFLKREHAMRKDNIGKAFELHKAGVQRAVADKQAEARSVASQHGLTEDEVPYLMGAYTKVDMEVRAKFRAIEKLSEASTVARAKTAKAPQTFATGTPSASATGDDAFMKKYATENYIPTEAEHVRAKKIIEEL